MKKKLKGINGSKIQKKKYSVLNQNENYAGMKPKTCAVGVRNATGILVPFSLSPKIDHQQQ